MISFQPPWLDGARRGGGRPAGEQLDKLERHLLANDTEAEENSHLDPV